MQRKTSCAALFFGVTVTVWPLCEALQEVRWRRANERVHTYTNVSKAGEAVAFPSGDGSLVPNFFSSTRAWTSSDGERIQAHSGTVFHDSKSGKWRWIGNSDPRGVQPGGSQNKQLSLYTSNNVDGPWGPQEVLLTIEQATKLSDIPSNIEFLERPHVHQRGGWYFLFVHLDDASYRQRKLGVFKMAYLQAPSESNPWTTVFAGNPGINANRDNRGFEVCDFTIFYDEVTQQLLYATTADSYVWKSPFYCDTDVTKEACRADLAHCRDCYNTGVVLFSVGFNGLDAGRLFPTSFTPVATLPGRWEGISLFRKPGDSENLYMLCSGQDGFGSNPVSLFSGVLGVTRELRADRATPSYYKWPAPLIFNCLGQPFSGSANAFNSQPTQVLQNPYDADFAIYMGDNWLHGPGKDHWSPGCAGVGQPGHDAECEPWTGTCPCGWPDSNCPGTSNPGANAGYVWLSFPWWAVGQTDYMLCAHPRWDVRRPPRMNDTCFTFNLLPDPKYTPGFQRMQDYGGESSYVPVVRSSCGFVECPGWPLTPEQNSDPACCSRLGDAITSAKLLGMCWRPDLCGGTCSDADFGNIPGGDAQCPHPRPFDSSKATLLGGESDCTTLRQPGGRVVDSCRGSHFFPGAAR